MNFTLKKTAITTWTLYVTGSDIELYTFTSCSSQEDATIRARAWASSWNSVSLTVEDEQNKKRN